MPKVQSYLSDINYNMYLLITKDLHTQSYLKDQNQKAYSFTAALPITNVMDATFYC
jgi:hypothetical protein